MEEGVVAEDTVVEEGAVEDEGEVVEEVAVVGPFAVTPVQFGTSDDKDVKWEGGILTWKEEVSKMNLESTSLIFKKQIDVLTWVFLYIVQRIAYHNSFRQIYSFTVSQYIFSTLTPLSTLHRLDVYNAISDLWNDIISKVKFRFGTV